MCCRGREIIAAMRHFPVETSWRILVRTIDCDTSHLEPNFVSSTSPRKPNRFVARVKKPLPPNTSSHKLPNHAFVSSWICKRFVHNTSARCASASSLFRSGCGRVAVGRQTSDFVVSKETAESSPLTSSLHFLQSSETAHPIDAGSTVTCLVHEDRPVADLGLGRHSSFGNYDHDPPSWEK